MTPTAPSLARDTLLPATCGTAPLALLSGMTTSGVDVSVFAVVVATDNLYFVEAGTGQSYGTTDRAALSPEELLDLQARLEPFADFWNAPGMEAYDEL